MIDTEKLSYFLRNANRMTVKELKDYSKKLLFHKDYDRIQDMTKKSDIIDDIVLRMFDMNNDNVSLRLKHKYFTNDVINDVEGLDYGGLEFLDNTRLVKIIDSKPYFYMGSVKYEIGKDLPKAIRKNHSNVLARAFYRYLIGGYDIYISRNDRYVPYK